MKTETTAPVDVPCHTASLLRKGTMMFGAGVGMLLLAGAVAKRPRAASMREDAVRSKRVIADLIALGGCLVGIRGVGSILEALKLGGAQSGLRLALEMQMQQQATSLEMRAIWDTTADRLSIRVDGEAGARRFYPTASGGAQAAV